MSSEPSHEKGAHSGEIVKELLTKDMALEVEETFRLVCDADGILSFSKLPLALKALGMSIADIPEESRIDQGEVIDLTAFVKCVFNCMKSSRWAAEEMKETFHYFDRSRNGVINRVEVRRLFNDIGESLNDAESEDQVCDTTPV